MIKNILDKIVEQKRIEVAEARKQSPEAVLSASEFFSRDTISLKENLQREGSTGIIAEFKRRSPSKGWINQEADVEEVTAAYTKYGASCLSVLTDRDFFGGSDKDLIAARKNNIPILRKEFIIDEYQLLEAKSIGADVVLLIAACLAPQRVKELAKFAKKLSLEVLLELHAEEELEHICEEVDFVGINNRNLKTFEVDVEHSVRLMQKLPAGKICIAESGIDNADVVIALRNKGFKGFLIGENFMKHQNPGLAFKEYVEQLKQKQHES